MPKQITLFIVIIVLTAFGACSTDNNSQKEASLSNLPDNVAGNTVKKGIEAAGGWENWTEKESLSYRKIISYYDSTGQLTDKLEQRHLYKLNPHFQAYISWEEDGDRIELINDGEESWKRVNGVVQTTKEDTSQAWNSTYGSHYVATMPFKLADPGTILADAGIDTLPNGEVARTIQVDYESWAGSAGGMHKWYYYFNTENNMLTANAFKYNDGRLGYTDYAAFAKADSILLPGKRISYPGSEKLSVSPDSTVYVHDQLQFDVAISDTLF